jgi:hypothetical protein
MNNPNITDSGSIQSPANAVVYRATSAGSASVSGYYGPAAAFVVTNANNASPAVYASSGSSVGVYSVGTGAAWCVWGESGSGNAVLGTETAGGNGVYGYSSGGGTAVRGDAAPREHPKRRVGDAGAHRLTFIGMQIIGGFWVYAAILEYLQHFSPGRNPTIADFVASALGALCGGLAVALVLRRLSV